MNASKFSFRQTWDDKIEVGDPAAPLSAVYRFSPKLPKPCVHPLYTPSAHQLSGFEMSDHVWHRGLWFTIKFINGTNFWEERPPFGIQVSKAQPLCETIAPNIIRITHLLDWNSEATGTVLNEKRVITYKPDPSGIGIIDWNTDLHFTQDATLDRTPYTTWGGYGGMSFRGARELHGTSFLLPKGETTQEIIGEPHDWVIMQGKMDEGIDQFASLGIIDHPTNPRNPALWYCKCASSYNFMNAAFLFHEPMTVQRGQTLSFGYRIVYRDGVWNTQEFAPLASAFRETEVAR